jgi:PAS domain S-box-containing protein
MNSLREIVEAFEQSFQQFPDAMILFSREGKCLQANQACLGLLHYEQQEIIGADADVLFGDRREWQRFRTELQQQGSLKDREMRLRRKDGTPIACVGTATAGRDKGQRFLGYTVVLRALTTEKELEHSLTSLLRISDQLNSTFDLDRLLAALVEQALALTSAASGCAGLRTADGMSCDHFRQGTSLVPWPYDCKPGTGWPGWVLTQGTYYLTNDAGQDPVMVPAVRERFGVTSGMSIPIIDSQKEVIAFFEVYNKTSGAEFTPQDVKNSLAAAQIASLAIQNGLTYRKLMALAAFSRSLTLANDLEQILEVVGHHLEINFRRGSVILLPAEEGLIVRFRTPEFIATAKEWRAATWCWEHSQEAGASTATVPEAQAYYLPLTVRGQVIGVLGLASRPGAWFSTLQRELLAGFLAPSALAIERGLLEQKVRRLRFLEESERVQNALLTAISHEVRAPLAAITAAVSGLLNSHFPLEPARERQLLRTSESEVKRLHRLMNNLLSVTRLEAGVSRVKLEPCDLSDVVGAALEELGTSTHRQQISLEIPPDLPLAPMDFDLITQVLVNLFSNALKFSPADQPIQLHSQMVNNQLEVMVIDQGVGVPEGDLERVFQKFHRLAESSAAEGLGLGLSICKEFVEAHRGQISLEQNPGGGTIARFVLPVPVSPMSI